ncbi:TPA: hypothetical protein ACPJ0X_004592 [Vibrio diabolicus]
MNNILFNNKPIIATITLCFISPLIAEYLLGIWSLRQLSSLLFLVPFYGFGALIVREAARRTHSGWIGIISFSLTFGLIEEGLLTQSFFNPDYYHADLISFGFIEALNTSPFWIVYVLGLHSLGSICLPILLVELNVSNSERTASWIGVKTLFAASIAYVASAVSIYIGTQQAFPFEGSHTTKLTVLAAMFLFITLPLIFKRYRLNIKVKAPKPTYVFLSTIALGGVFFGQHYFKESFGFSQNFVALSMFIAYTVSLSSVWYWSHATNWQDSHLRSLAISLLTIYGVLGLYQYTKHTTALGYPITTVDIVLQIFLFLSLLLPLIFRVNQR